MRQICILDESSYTKLTIAWSLRLYSLDILVLEFGGHSKACLTLSSTRPGTDQVDGSADLSGRVMMSVQLDCHRGLNPGNAPATLLAYLRDGRLALRKK
jgi:hypothetical protein